jgi:chemotaxis protein methyltransferase CheR
MPTIAPAAMSDADYLRFKKLLSERSGLDYSEKRRGELARRLVSAMEESEYSTFFDYYKALTTSQSEIDRLISLLTIGETYFFRTRKHFEALANTILPETIRARAASTRHIRMWSAGCSTGEEPYSLAITLLNALPDATRWNVTVLGTDIDREALRKARDAAYRPWSFRGVDGAFRGRYFRSEGDRWLLNDDVRDMVSFEYLNLVEDSYPSMTTNTNAMDVIFCRNVTIYFSPATTKVIVNKLFDALLPGGWMIVGPSEADVLSYGKFLARRVDGSILYQRPPAQEKLSTTASLRPVPTRPFEASVPVPLLKPSDTTPAVDARDDSDTHPAQSYQRAIWHLKRGYVDAALIWLRRQVELTPDFVPAHLLLAKTHANRGELTEAEFWCRRALEHDNLSQHANYLLALVHEETGQREKAITSLRRTLFLDPKHPLAHYVLGTLYWQSGHDSMARRAWTNAAEILRGWPPDRPIPESDGETAGRLLEILEGQIDDHLLTSAGKR